MKYQKLSKTFRSHHTASVALILIASLLAVFARLDHNFRRFAQPVRARHGIVASTNEVARTGRGHHERGGKRWMRLLRLVSRCVTHPAAGNLVRGFMMIRLKDGRRPRFDYREMAPAGASATSIWIRTQCDRSEGGSIEGYRAAGVPGTVRGMELALKKYGSGKLSWAS